MISELYSNFVTLNRKKILGLDEKPQTNIWTVLWEMQMSLAFCFLQDWLAHKSTALFPKQRDHLLLQAEFITLEPLEQGDRRGLGGSLSWRQQSYKVLKIHKHVSWIGSVHTRPIALITANTLYTMDRAAPSWSKVCWLKVTSDKRNFINPLGPYHAMSQSMLLLLTSLKGKCCLQRCEVRFHATQGSGTVREISRPCLPPCPVSSSWYPQPLPPLVPSLDWLHRISHWKLAWCSFGCPAHTAHWLCPGCRVGPWPASRCPTSSGTCGTTTPPF